MSNFEDIITSEEELRNILGFPSDLVSRKTVTFIDQNCRNFIEHSPFLLISSSDKTGRCDVSPRGDVAGFVLVQDEKSLVIPERPGNRKIDTMRNILSNPHIGLIFIIPGLEETLRINGNACVIRNKEILQQMQANNKIPSLGIGLEVEECFIHCAKAFKRSQLWNPKTWLEKEKLPKAAKILADHSGIESKEIEELLQESYTKRLY